MATLTIGLREPTQASAVATAGVTPAASNTASAPAPRVCSAMKAGTSAPPGSSVVAPSASIAARRVGDGSTTKTSSRPLPRSANHRPIPMGPAPNTTAVSPAETSPNVAAW